MEENNNNPQLTLHTTIRFNSKNQFVGGSFCDYEFIATVNDEKSKNCINGGRVIELKVWQSKDSNDEEQKIAYYNGIWNLQAENPKERDACSRIIDILEQIPTEW